MMGLLYLDVGLSGKQGTLSLLGCAYQTPFLDSKKKSENFEIRVLLRFCWKKGLSAAAAAREICEVEGEGTVSERTAQKWFKRFNEGRTELEDYLDLTVNSEAVRQAVEANPCVSTREMSSALGESQTNVLRHLHLLHLQKRKNSCPKTARTFGST